ncbi:MAG TPA: hypothetical protein QGG47_09365 [Acidobacteriota bacterium]|nr:hypothetical protein [Acidobacteriota bacterium]
MTCQANNENSENERKQAQEGKTFKDLAKLYLLEHALGSGVKRGREFDVWTVKTIQGEPGKRSWAEDRRKLARLPAAYPSRRKRTRERLRSRAIAADRVSTVYRTIVSWAESATRMR